MLVKTSKDGLSGLHIGEANARRYFSKTAPFIELKLDDLRIQCTLTPDFWQDRPEIRDTRLSEWLDFKVGRRHQGREPILLSMVPSGAGAFLLRLRSETPNEAFGADVSQPRTVQPERLHSSASMVPSRSVA